MSNETATVLVPDIPGLWQADKPEEIPTTTTATQKMTKMEQVRTLYTCTCTFTCVHYIFTCIFCIGYNGKNYG